MNLGSVQVHRPRIPQSFVAIAQPARICLKHLRTVSADDATTLWRVNSTSAISLISPSALTPVSRELKMGESSKMELTHPKVVASSAETLRGRCDRTGLLQAAACSPVGLFYGQARCRGRRIPLGSTAVRSPISLASSGLRLTGRRVGPGV